MQDKYRDHFEVLNDRSNGWEIVFKLHFRHKLSWDELQSESERVGQDYINDCHAFLHELWYGPLDDEMRNHPVIGFIRKYLRKSVNEKGFPAFLIHPTSPHYDEKAIDEMLRGIVEAKIAFELKSRDTVEEYLSAMTPPR
jgi:hypothetical protein